MEAVLLAQLPEILDEFGEEAAVQEADPYRGAPVKSIAVPMGEVFYAFAGDLLVATYGRSTLEAALHLASAPGRSLASDAAFQKVAAKTGWAHATLGLYLRPESIISQFAPMLPREAQQVIGAWALKNVAAIGMTSRFADGGIRDVAYFYAPGERGGILPPPGPTADPSLLQYAPKNASLVSLSGFDPDAQYGQFLKMIKAQDPEDHERMLDDIRDAEEELGFRIREDLVASLGTQLAFFGAPYETVLMVQLKNPGAFEECLRKATSLIREQAAWGELDYLGSKIHHLDITAAPVPVCPSYTVYKGFAVVGLYPQTLKSFLARMRRGGESIAQDESFLRVCGRFMTGSQTFSYMGMDRQLTGFYSLLAMGSHAVHGTGVRLRVALLPPPRVVAPYMFDLGAGSFNDAEGVLVEYFSPFGAWGAAFAGIGAVVDLADIPVRLAAAGNVTTIGTASAMLLPALTQAREKARQTESRSNMRQIGLGMSMYCTDFDELYPEKIEDLYDEYISAAQIFVNPSDKNPMTIGKGLKCSYVYVGRLSKSTEAMVIVLYDKRGNHKDGRNVLFYDGGVEWVPEQLFRQQLQESFDLVKQDRGWKQFSAERRRAIEQFYTDAVPIP